MFRIPTKTTVKSPPAAQDAASVGPAPRPAVAAGVARGSGPWPRCTTTGAKKA